MNTIQRLLSNTALAFVANVVNRAGTTLLFILIGRVLGPTNSGVFSLGTTYFTIIFGLSALGLHELLVREVAPRRDESARYLTNYMALRLLFSVVSYLLLVLGLWVFQPYSAQTTQVVLILTLAALPEAVATLCGSLFEAHERLAMPAVASIVNAAVKLAGGLWLLQRGASAGGMDPVAALAWLMVVASVAGMLVYPPALVRLFRRWPQAGRIRPDLAFSLFQLRQTPGFFTIHLFSVLDYQTDAFLISLMLTETELGYYSAALTITLAISLMSLAVRAAIYPVMSRYAHEAPDKLILIYTKANQYLLALSLPIAAAVCILAGPIVRLIFGDAFGPAVPVLQISVWAAVFLLMNVPNARLMLVNNRQVAAAWLTGLSMTANILANLVLIPWLGISGSAAARVFSSATFFLSLHLYVRANILRGSFLPLLPRPLLATALMALVMWPLRALPLAVPLAAGAATYAAAALLLRIVPPGDLVYWRQALRRPS